MHRRASIACRRIVPSRSPVPGGEDQDAMDGSMDGCDGWVGRYLDIVCSDHSSRGGNVQMMGAGQVIACPIVETRDTIDLALAR